MGPRGSGPPVANRRLNAGGWLGGTGPDGLAALGPELGHCGTGLAELGGRLEEGWRLEERWRLEGG
jgi:hypothetical protein